MFTYLGSGESTGLGSAATIGINPDVFGKDNIIRVGKGVVLVNDGGVHTGHTGLLCEDALTREKRSALALECHRGKGQRGGSAGKEGDASRELHCANR